MAVLTDAAARAAKKGEVDRDLADGTVPGLSLRVFKSGRKAWALRLRVHGGGQRRLDLGEYPGTTLAQARELATEARRRAGRGEDPEHVIRPPAAPPGATVAMALERWLATKAGNRSMQLEKRRMALHVEPVIGTRDVREVSRGDLAELLHDMAFGTAPKPVEANRTYTSLRGFFGWCAAMDIRPDDPTILLKKPVKFEPSAIRLREGTEPLLSMDDLARLWRTAPRINSAVLGDLVRCMLLVPLRRDEWTDLPWTEVREAFAGDGWTGSALAVPAARMKGKRPANVPLPSQAVAILEARKKITGRGEHVFAVPDHRAPFSGWKRGAAALRKALDSRTAWSPHTIRKSVATALVRDLGADELLVGRILQQAEHLAPGRRPRRGVRSGFCNGPNLGAAPYRSEPAGRRQADAQCRHRRSRALAAAVQGYRPQGQGRGRAIERERA
ncbi:integrase family protein [Roseomonas sp. JC162]|uniref:Integrase family protein n=1 Tax=Neoroseomonas marina TaxID=1232220 RepID=A0A848EL30_9PROT|nr:integrase arm-type DNA-binding domain-containing protein [Neoroseomonas marina]NMJ44215.1 integrase family protein [Neoroseomonas marina]